MKLKSSIMTAVWMIVGAFVATLFTQNWGTFGYFSLGIIISTIITKIVIFMLNRKKRNV